MRRADRLFQLVQALRRRPVVTAATLARELEVSERTVYRDIRDLITSGVPIEGEAGVGYTLRKGYDLPPLMFTITELEALVLGARVVQSWGDAALAKSATDALARVEAAIPDRLRPRIQGTPLYAPAFHVSQRVARHLAEVRDAIDHRQRLAIRYTDAAGEETERVIRPLGLFFWGATWTAESWCELRDDFRGFRLDRIRELAVVGRYEPVPGQGIDDFFAAMARDHPDS